MQRNLIISVGLLAVVYLSAEVQSDAIIGEILPVPDPRAASRFFSAPAGNPDSASMSRRLPGYFFSRLDKCCARNEAVDAATKKCRPWPLDRGQNPFDLYPFDVTLEELDKVSLSNMQFSFNVENDICHVFHKYELFRFKNMYFHPLCTHSV